MQNNNNNNNNNTTKYTTVKSISMYSQSSAMILGYSSDGFGRSYGTITLAPRFEETKGKDPERGQKIYDYDNSIFVSLDAFNLKRLNMLLSSMLSGTAIGEVEVKTGTDTNGCSVRVIRDSSLEGYKGKEVSLDFTLYVEKTTGDNTVACEFNFTAEQMTALVDVVGKPTNATSDEIDLGISNISMEVFADWVAVAAKAVLSPLDYISLKTKHLGGASSNGGSRPQQTSGRFISRRGTSNSAAANSDATAAESNTPWQETEEGDEDLPF